MSIQGITSAEFQDITDQYDPRVTATYGVKGTIFRYVSLTSGVNPIILIKQSTGVGIDWLTPAQMGFVAAARETSADTVLSPYIDYSLFVHTNAAAITVTLPLGQEGLTFAIKDVDGNASVNNITVAPTSPDTMDPRQGSPFEIPGNYNSYIFEYFSGVWWVMSAFLE